MLRCSVPTPSNLVGVSVSHLDQKMRLEKEQAFKSSMLTNRRAGLEMRRLVNMLVLDACSFSRSFFGSDKRHR